MHKYIIALVALAAIHTLVTAPSAQAQPAPYTSTATIAAKALTVTWDAPAATYGPLLSLQSVGLNPAATIACSHLIAYGSSSFITNSVETAATGGSLLVYPQSYIAPQIWASTNSATTVSSPVKPVWIAPGDKLLFTVSLTNTVPSYIVIRAGFPGK